MTLLRLVARDPDAPPAPRRPLLIDRVEPGCDSYVTTGYVPSTNLRRRWLFFGRVRSVEHRAGGVVKERNNFKEHLDESAFRGFLSECEARGVTRPSSYGDCFHQRIRTPRHPPYARKMFPTVPGAWQALTGAQGRFTEPLYQYDIRSAYLWSLQQGLPHPATFRRVKRYDGPGVYWCQSPAETLLPYPWNQPGMFPASDQEIEALHLQRRVTVGVTFAPGTFDIAPLIGDITQWHCWKPIARSYWGRWATQGAVSVETLDDGGRVRTQRNLPDPTRAPVWAALITARVRMRLWEIRWQVPVSRVYVDSIVTTARIPTGDAVGDWALKEEYPRGGLVRMTGVESRAA